MTPAEWDRMPWHARAAYLRALSQRERAVCAAEESARRVRRVAAEVEESAPSISRAPDDAEWQTNNARYLLRQLPSDAPDVIAARRALLEDLGRVDR